MSAGEDLRVLLQRRELAATRLRMATRRHLRLSDIELLALAFMAARPDVTPTRLAAMLELSSGGITALVQRLERDGHLVRRPHRSDRRSCVVELSSASLESGAALLDPLAGDAGKLFAALDEAQQAVVLAFLRDLVAAGERRTSEGANAPDDREPQPAVPSVWA